MEETQEKIEKRHTVGKCIADRNFPPDIYVPTHEIIYEDRLNAEILKVLQIDTVHYRNIFIKGKHRNTMIIGISIITS